MALTYQQIQLEDKEQIDTYLKPYHFENSELTFMDLFVWRKSWSFEWAQSDGALYIRGKGPDGSCFIYPPFARDRESLVRAMDHLIAQAKEQGKPLCMREISEPLAGELRSLYADQLIFTYNDDYSDYVYNRQDLLELKGKRYHAKRNHVNRFKSLYAYCYEPLSPENVEECAQAAARWEQLKQEAGLTQEEAQTIAYEHIALREALSHFEALQAQGGAIRIDGQIQAFCVGELLTPQVGCVHFEKADAQYHGLYAVINQEFIAHTWPEALYINREEDMGLPGLRKAKQSYYPVKMIRKYRAELR
ncbi:Uncharacterized conserved protein [uncultured Clostridium sp.]|nr:Uncharacterized conserved protein [uncultured Clostridium sp.]